MFFIKLKSKYGKSFILSPNRVPISQLELNIYLTLGSTMILGLLLWSLNIISQVYNVLLIGDTITRSKSIEDIY